MLIKVFPKKLKKVLQIKIMKYTFYVLYGFMHIKFQTFIKKKAKNAVLKEIYMQVCYNFQFNY